MSNKVLFVFGVLILGLCGCLPGHKYAGSEYPSNKEGMGRLQHDLDQRILNSISPLDKPLDARVLVQLPSRSSVESEYRKPHVKAKTRQVSNLPPGYYLFHSKRSVGPAGRFTLSPKDQSDALQEALERDLEIRTEALRRRNLFREVDVTREDDTRAVPGTKYDITILFPPYAETPGMIKVGENQPETMSEEISTEELPRIQRKAELPPLMEPMWDSLERIEKRRILAWLDLVEKTVAQRLENR